MLDEYNIKGTESTLTPGLKIFKKAEAKKLGKDTISEMDCDKVERVELCKDGTIIVKVCETEATKTAQQTENIKMLILYF